MPVKPFFDPDHLYFVTTSVVNHIPLFKREPFIRIVLDSLHFFRTNKGILLFAFVIMPNHLHFIARFNEAYKLSDMIRDFKRHTARQIIRELQAKKSNKILETLTRANTDKRQQFKIWEDEYDARDIYSTEFLEQKMDYIHNNPCQPQWKLVELPEDYPWSSARFYLLDQPSIIPVDDVRDLLV
jgi:putative transposase